MAIKRNDITIGISGAELETLKQEQMNEFQDKRITWQGEENVLVTTVLQRLYEFAAGKVQIVLADTLPLTTEPNTQYWVKTYSGSTLEDGRFIIMTDYLNIATYIGTSSVDLTDYYKKTEVDEKLDDLTVGNFRDGVIITSIGTSTGNSVIPTGGAVRVALSRKQDTIVASDQSTTPTDTDKLSYINNVTNNRWTFAKIWDWIVTKLTANTEKGIRVSSGKLGHTNNITVPTAKRILQATYDAQGHVTAIENEFNWSNNYANSAENQLFTRKGANALYKELNDVSEETISYNTSYIQANYSKVFKVGKVYMCNIAFQAKSSDIPANTWLIRLSGNVVKSGTEVYCVLNCTDLTNVPTTRLLQLGGASSFNQFFVKTNALIGGKYYFGSCIIIKNA